MQISPHTSVSSLVRDDIRTAEIFSKYQIDFCCKGEVSLTVACESKGLHLDKIIAELNKVTLHAFTEEPKFNAWELDMLIEHILSEHHAYILNKAPTIVALLSKLVNVHGAKHPEIKEIEYEFKQSYESLIAHMQKEERILFPYIIKMIQFRKYKQNSELPNVRSILQPIKTMKAEHQVEGLRFEKIREISQNYTVPRDGCATYLAAYSMLEDFETNLHAHVHLENNILFPKAIHLEEVITSNL